MVKPSVRRVHYAPWHNDGAFQNVVSVRRGEVADLADSSPSLCINPYIYKVNGDML